MEWAKPILSARAGPQFQSPATQSISDETGKLAWFDELLNTQRSAAVRACWKEGGAWRVNNTSLPPWYRNDLLDTVIKPRPRRKIDHPGAGKEIMLRNGILQT